MPWRCYFGFHAWGIWGKKFNPNPTRYALEYQQRTCKCCGITKERRIQPYA